jgi:hypothetical protein
MKANLSCLLKIKDDCKENLSLVNRRQINWNRLFQYALSKLEAFQRKSMPRTFITNFMGHDLAIIVM